MKISIVVATYNEENDIAATLDSLVALQWPNFEIIVVDDSNDRTPDIVRSYENRGVRLIRPDKREGRCGARNLGIIESAGEVVVILNADVHLPVDFLSSIAEHYAQGADYVLVRSVIANPEDLFARYIESVGLYDYYGENQRPMEWTEGFSCRRSIAIDAELFPTGYAVPLCAGEDGVFGDNLHKLGAKKIIDLNIVCEHIAPASFSEYWYIRKGRGHGSPQVRRFLQGWSFGHITIRATLRILRTVMMMITLLPMLYVNYRYAKKSPGGLSDLFPFCWAWLVEQIAFSVGEWESLFQIRRAEMTLNKGKQSATTR
jgi:glycosyltransferase involved in cell wall biosynthesis